MPHISACQLDSITIDGIHEGNASDKVQLLHPVTEVIDQTCQVALLERLCAYAEYPDVTSVPSVTDKYLLGPRNADCSRLNYHTDADKMAMEAMLAMFEPGRRKVGASHVRPTGVKTGRGLDSKHL